MQERAVLVEPTGKDWVGAPPPPGYVFCHLILVSQLMSQSARNRRKSQEHPNAAALLRLFEYETP